MKHTTNYNLNMPENTDFFSVDHMNENMTTIDTEMHSLEVQTETVAEKIGSSSDTGNTTVMGKLNTIAQNNADKFDLLPDSSFTEYVTNGFIIGTNKPNGFLYEGKGLIIINRYQYSGSAYGTIYIDGDTNGFKIDDYFSDTGVHFSIKFKNSVKLIGNAGNGFFYTIMRKEGY